MIFLKEFVYSTINLFKSHKIVLSRTCYILSPLIGNCQKVVKTSYQLIRTFTVKTSSDRLVVRTQRCMLRNSIPEE